MHPQATLTRTIPGTVLDNHAPFRWGMGFLLLYTLVVVGRIHEIFPEIASLRVGLITGGLAVLAWVLAPGSFQDKVPTGLRPVRYVLILLALAIVTIPISVWPGHSLDFLAGKYSKTVMLFLLIVFWCRSVQDARRVILACCFGGIALVLSGLLTGRVGNDRFYADSGTYDANDLALLLVMLFPLVLYLFSTSRRLLLLLFSVLPVICLYGVVLTQSRAGFVALTVVGALILWRSNLGGTTKVISALAALLVFGALAGGIYWERMGTIWTPQGELDTSAGGRRDIWKTALVLLATHPWGVGIDGFETAEGLSHGGFGKWSAAHNSFLQVAVELGVAGLLVFLLWILRTLRDLRTIQARTKNMFALASLRGQEETPRSPSALAPLAASLEISLWGFVVGGFFLSQAYSGLLYVVLALSVACVRLAKLNETLDQRTKSSSMNWSPKSK